MAGVADMFDHPRGTIIVSDQPENITLVYLRRLDAKMDRLTETMEDASRRATSPEGPIAVPHGDFAGQSVRMDRMELRLERVERRLDLVEAP